MSLWSTERLQAALSRTRVELRVIRGRKRAEVARVVREVPPWSEPAGGDGSAAATSWSAGVAAALDELAQQHAISGLGADLCFADGFAHFDVAKGEFAACTDAQVGAMASACLHDLLGTEVDSMTLRWHLQDDERHLLLCALPTALLDDVHRLLDARQVTLLGFVPDFARRWNAVRSDFSRGTGVFASTSDELGVAALVRKGVIRGVSATTHPLRPDGQSPAGGLTARLDTQANRLLSAFGVPSDGVDRFVVVDARVDLPPPSDRWVLHPDMLMGAQ